MTDDLMRYDLLAQNAMRGVVREALKIAEREGLPGEHHFFISFKTDAPGVVMSEQLRDQYPDDMPIVLQHQYWNLHVEEERFSVELSFNGKPELLVIPYTAILAFYDPHVQFTLQFQYDDEGAQQGGDGPDDAAAIQPSEASETSADEEPKGEVVSLDQFRNRK